MPSDPASDENPYAPPRSGVDGAGPLLSLARIDRKCLVVPRDWQSPRICLLSGNTENLTPAKPIRWVAVVPVIGLLLLSVITAFGSAAVSLILLTGAAVSFALPQGPNPFRLFGATDIHWFLTRRMARSRKWQWRLRTLFITAALLLPKFLPASSSFYLASMLCFALAALTRMLAPEFLTNRITGDSVSFLGIPEEVMEKVVQADLKRRMDSPDPLSIPGTDGKTV